MLGLANFTCQYAAPKGARKSHPHLAPRGVYDLSASALGEATAAPTSFGGGFRSAFRFFTGAASGFLGFGVALLTFSPSSRPSFLPARGSDWISLSSDCERALQDLDRGVSDPVRSCARIGRSRPEAENLVSEFHKVRQIWSGRDIRHSTCHHSGCARQLGLLAGLNEHKTVPKGNCLMI